MAKKDKIDCMLYCRNMLCVFNHNVIFQLLKFYSKHPKVKLSQKDFMNMSLVVWKQIKKEYKIGELKSKK
jgi:hypothetical protein